MHFSYIGSRAAWCDLSTREPVHEGCPSMSLDPVRQFEVQWAGVLHS